MKYKPSDEVVLCLLPCAAIHTWGMKHPIDVSFCDRDMRVMKTHRNLPPRKFLSCKGATCVFERYACRDDWPKVGDFVVAEVLRVE